MEELGIPEEELQDDNPLEEDGEEICPYCEKKGCICDENGFLADD
jgi:hypothetical protein